MQASSTGSSGRRRIALVWSANCVSTPSTTRMALVEPSTANVNSSGSPGFRLVAVPATWMAAMARTLSSVMFCGRLRRTCRLFHSRRAARSSLVSKLCAVSPGPGTLCARVPAGIVTGSTWLVSSVQAR